MLAMLLDAPNQALREVRIPIPVPGAYEILIKVNACGVCRTDLHIIDGDLPPHKLPLILGHEAVGTVVGAGEFVEPWKMGQRVGVPWLWGTCRHCSFCLSNRENLCDTAVFSLNFA